MSPPQSRRHLWPLLWASAAFLVFAPAGWLLTDRLEQNDDFCNACHLASGTALHAGKRRDFDARPAPSLAALHGAARVSGRDDAAFHCIDCHGGTGWLGRARVKLLSARDGFWYALGRFEEPEGMHWPLLDADCRKCHSSFGHSSFGEGAEAFEDGAGAAPTDPAFHALAVHNHRLGMSCVACHLSHESGGLDDLYFLKPAHVRVRCSECHPEFSEVEQ